MAIRIPLLLLLNHPLELRDPICSNRIAHLADSPDHLFRQYIANFGVAWLIGLFVFAVVAVGAWPGYIHEI